ncbi:type IV pilus assembly protein PilN [Granulicella rosea]|uniref:Type IV pilus assembly protein PilN n=1 Tax=Granulicella rosea TaxID=474952 RepID=A0A239L2V4_9BACT|nr:PilN domain-containing protein [Granulicella rosea]SNT24675.1 type IV pilus assembly protein PilN [Granulicella rosea]
MRIQINLATRPFVELRPLYAKIRLAMVVLAVLAIGLSFGLRSLTAKADAAQAQMNALKAQTRAVENERELNESRMKQPGNKAVLDRSQFLNAVFARKSFSWTSVMMDLERVLPAGVQVTSIEPNVTKEGDVNIRLRVSGDRDQAVQLVRNLERSQRFLAPRLASETAQVTDPNKTGAMNVSVDPLKLTGVEFDILSNYNPLSMTVVKAQVKHEQAAAASATPVVHHNRKPQPPAPKLSARPAAPVAGGKR